MNRAESEASTCSWQVYASVLWTCQLVLAVSYTKLPRWALGDPLCCLLLVLMRLHLGHALYCLSIHYCVADFHDCTQPDYLDYVTVSADHVWVRFAADFVLLGGAGPLTWLLAAGMLPMGATKS